MGAVNSDSLPSGVVTLVFTDIEGSTKLLHEIGDAYCDVLAHHHRVLREVRAAHGGVEAARVRMAGVQALVDALARGADALGRGTRDMPARQRGLRAALDWTVSLLEADQRELFAGLGVFADAWTIEQAERVFGGELDLWEAMAALIDFSLVHTRGDGRLTMAERVRTHARELLSANGREHELRARHAELMVETMEALNLELSLDVHPRPHAHAGRPRSGGTRMHRRGARAGRPDAGRAPP